jgi:high affinity sulfate transporter 1
MQASGERTEVGLLERLGRFAPGLPALVRYRRGDFAADLVAGLSVAAVALPIGVAYAELAGFPAVVGLYASILPLVAYALFGTSRQLVVGPDTATCAMVAAAVAPLAGGDAELYQSLSVTLAFLAGLLCIAGSFLRLGALADFLSKPILVGFLNGVALSILLGQIGKLFGFPIESARIVPRLVEFVSKLGQTHAPTLAVGLGTFAVLALAPRLVPRLPAPLVAVILAALAVKVFNLDALGVATLGSIPAGLPSIRIPHVSLDVIPQLLAQAAGLALICFSSMMITSRSFASKNRYDVDADREFAALGAANIAAALSQGFAISGADSRTAMSDASGGRTQMTGLVAAAAVALVLIFFTTPLRYVPVAALGAVLVRAALSLMGIAELREIHRIDRRESGLSLVATLGVVAVGAIDAILVAVGLALVRFVRLVSRPPVEVLGETPELAGFHSVARHAGARTTPGLLLFRFNGPLVFFNAPYWKRQLLAAADAAGPELRWLVLDMLPVTFFDATGAYTAREVFDTLRARGVVVATAARKTELESWFAKRGLTPRQLHAFATLREALDAYSRATGTPAREVEELVTEAARGGSPA